MQKNNSLRYNYANTQNFITDRQLIQKIVNLSNINRSDFVLEIGTGKGHLTEALCQKGGYIFSVEIDGKLFAHTKTKLKNLNNLKLIQGDFLRYPLPAKGRYKVFANIPYDITTPIIEKLTNAKNPPAEMWLILEKGAAKRFTGSSRETLKSLLLKPFWEMKILHRFRREDFHPMPSVDSVLLHFSRKEKPDLEKGELPAFRHFVTYSLQHGIGSRQGLLTKRQVATALKLAGLPPAWEDGVTLYIQWLCLFQYFRKISK